MLESEIKRLTDAVEALTAAINAQQGAHATPAPPSKPMPAVTPDDIEKESPTATTVEDTPSAPVTRDELKDMCLAIVRSDKEKKPKVAAAIASFGEGVKLLKDVPDDKLAELKTKLEAI